MSLASENTLETEHFMPLDHFSNFSGFRCTQHFYVILKTFFQRQNQRGKRLNLTFSSVLFRRRRKKLRFGGFWCCQQYKKNDGDWPKRPEFSGFFCFFSEFQGISCFPIEKYLVLRSYIMKKIVPHNIEEMSGNSICQESPGKHPGNTRERCIY